MFVKNTNGVTDDAIRHRYKDRQPSKKIDGENDTQRYISCTSCLVDKFYSKTKVSETNEIIWMDIQTGSQSKTDKKNKHTDTEIISPST